MDATELQAIAERNRAARKRIRLHCCTSSGCQASHSLLLKQGLEAAVQAAGLQDEVDVAGVGCMGFCGQGPLVEVDPDGLLFEYVTPDDAPAIVAALSGGDAPGVARGNLRHPFFARQQLVVRRNGGKIDPERIDEYITAGGYQALARALHDMTPADVVDTITRSGLRGRGGAGYPTGLKWATVAKAAGERKFVVCNGDEGDPGAFMDRSILESDPHSVLEGMAIAAYAVGASQGFLYVRGEYPLAIQRLQKAIQHAKKYDLLGTQILDTAFNFRVDIRIGAGAFVCGEETALMASIEGRRGQPRPRPPYPAEHGLWGCPTLINNVETFANIAPIISNGADWYASIGTAKSKGTKVFALTGNIRNNGLIEVPMGTTLREIVEELGGGAPDGATVKAVQTGGPSGGCIPAHLFDTPVDYESLAAVGSIMGSGGMVVMDDQTDMVDVAAFYMAFCMDESCGKCIPCRVGTVQMHRLLKKIAAGNATSADVALLKELCAMVKTTSLCGLGQSAPNPVLSTLTYFPEEYESRLRPR
ncbi:MAG: NADH-quinone oxidoreductase subunit NuoF [Chloroflexaceae bacterium]|jgi:bidirectional [NiFe] hydrogenase diaphorase subunit|nr:NADH-quinone oxidoreductase subunit NuoF [Chloroflexaceae bacterium]